MLNPILASSALKRMRSARAVIVLCAYQLVLLAILCVSMFSVVFEDTITIESMQQGVTTYFLLMAAQFGLIVLVAPAMTAGSIAGERERQTLELLLVTNTGSLRIVLGKLMENLAYLALLIFSGMPVMCLTMVLGGVSLNQVLGGMLFLLVCAFAAACVGMFCSSFMKNTVAATVVAYVVILAIGIGTLMPLPSSVGSKSMTDVLYDETRYAALTRAQALGMTPKLILLNPGIGLLALIEHYTSALQSALGGHGRLYCTYMLMRKIGFGRVAVINMAAMALLAALLLLLASRFVRPKRVRMRSKK